MRLSRDPQRWLAVKAKILGRRMLDSPILIVTPAASRAYGPSESAETTGLFQQEPMQTREIPVTSVPLPYELLMLRSHAF